MTSHNTTQTPNTSDFSAITALSPLDGRYAAKLAKLRPIMSEFGYLQYRVQVEITWFVGLSDAGFDEFKPLSKAARSHLLNIMANFQSVMLKPLKTLRK